MTSYILSFIAAIILGMSKSGLKGWGWLLLL